MILTGLGWVGAGLIVLGAGLVFWLRDRRSWVGALRSGLAGLICLALGFICVSVWASLRSFQAFTTRTLVAEVRCRPVGPQEFEISLVQHRDGRPQPPETYRLRGDQWMISGGVVKWHPWLTALGLPSYQKPTRLSGRFVRLTDELAAAPSAVDLNGGEDRLWEWFVAMDRYLPFVETSYGSAAFAEADPAAAFSVYATPFGYLIDRLI